jgi:hypothetical protein
VGEDACEGEEPQPETFGFPASGGVVVQGEHLHPRGQVGGQGDDGEPDPGRSLCEIVAGKKGAPAGFEAAPPL